MLTMTVRAGGRFSMDRLGLVLVACCFAACKSSAPYTIPAAGLNTLIGVTTAMHSRASGGCYAVCVYGTVCNASTGMCEPARCGGGCDVSEVCVEAEAALWRCVPRAALSAERSMGTGQPAPLVPGLPGLGVSPATGSVPTLPPAKSSVEGP
jgi:hypothetical protein